MHEIYYNLSTHSRVILLLKGKLVLLMVVLANVSGSSNPGKKCGMTLKVSVANIAYKFIYGIYPVSSFNGLLRPYPPLDV